MLCKGLSQLWEGFLLLIKTGGFWKSRICSDSIIQCLNAKAKGHTTAYPMLCPVVKKGIGGSENTRKLELWFSWESACLACKKPWVPSPAEHKARHMPESQHLGGRDKGTQSAREFPALLQV